MTQLYFQCLLLFADAVIVLHIPASMVVCFFAVTILMMHRRVAADVECCFRCVFLIVCVNLRCHKPRRQNRYGWRRRILLRVRLIKFYGGLRLMKSTAA